MTRNAPNRKPTPAKKARRPSLMEAYKAKGAFSDANFQDLSNKIKTITDAPLSPDEPHTETHSDPHTEARDRTFDHIPISTGVSISESEGVSSDVSIGKSESGNFIY